VPPPVTFSAALVAALRAQGGRPAAPGPGAPSWAEVADGARLLALGLRDAGVTAGTRVRVAAPDAAPHERIGTELAVLAAGGVLVGAHAGVDLDLGPDGLGGTDAAPATALAALRERGTAVDRDRPDAHEAMLAALAPDAPAFVEAGRTITQGQARWALHCVDRWIGAAFGPGALDVAVGPAAAVEADLAARLLAAWWPASVGARLAAPTDPSPAALRALAPSYAVLTPEVWAALAGALRATAGRSLGGTTLLRRGRVLAAGESTGRVDRAGLAAARRWSGPRVRGGTGLGDLVVGISLGTLAAGEGRDLDAAAVPVLATWVVPGIPAPVAAGSVARPDPASGLGRPLPGRTVESAGPTTIVGGGDLPGGSVEVDGRVRIDGRGRVELPPAAPARVPA